MSERARTVVGEVVRSVTTRLFHRLRLEARLVGSNEDGAFLSINGCYDLAESALSIKRGLCILANISP
jgi:hypothetical protein